jgi:hypothetical protein
VTLKAALIAVLGTTITPYLLCWQVRPDPIKALVWAAIINGVTAAPAMCFMMLLASRRTVMGKLSLPAYIMAPAAAVSSPSKFRSFSITGLFEDICDRVDSLTQLGEFLGVTSVGLGAPRQKAFAVRTLENRESKLALASKKRFSCQLLVHSGPNVISANHRDTNESA